MKVDHGLEGTRHCIVVSIAAYIYVRNIIQFARG
jgi:hypothetical protein